MKKLISAYMIFFAFICVHTDAQKDSAAMWFQKKEWLNGMHMQPHQSIDEQTFWHQYKLNKNLWDEAFAFLKEQDLEKLAVGKYPIDSDNVYAIVSENKTKPYDSTKWESHRNYVDLHYVISGVEKIGVASIDKLTVTMPYDAEKDLINYFGEGKIYEAKHSAFFLFFPQDAHRPGISTGDIVEDKKIVIKIKYSE